jgi:hypothetical protein
MEESLLHPPGQQYPEGRVISSEPIPDDVDVQRSYLHRIGGLKPWQLAQVIKDLQTSAGIEPDDFPGLEPPVANHSANKRRVRDELKADDDDYPREE